MKLALCPVKRIKNLNAAANTRGLVDKMASLIENGKGLTMPKYTLSSEAKTAMYKTLAAGGDKFSQWLAAYAVLHNMRSFCPEELETARQCFEAFKHLSE